MRIRRRASSWVAAVLLAWLCSQPALFACPVCFQVQDGPAADGVRAAVAVLLGATVVVLAVVGTWWVRFVRAQRP
jgi:hypothetical protein